MIVPTFALEVWTHEHEARTLRYNLSGSTGPAWTLSELLALEDLAPDALADDWLTYAPVTGTDELREAVGAHTDSAPEHVQVTSGAAEGLAMLVAAGATPGGNVVFPEPGYPSFGALASIFDQGSRPYRLCRHEGFRLNPQRVINLIDDRTGLVIVNPTQPHGRHRRRGRDACYPGGRRAPRRSSGDRSSTAPDSARPDLAVRCGDRRLRAGW